MVSCLVFSHATFEMKQTFAHKFRDVPVMVGTESGAGAGSGGGGIGKIAGGGSSSSSIPISVVGSEIDANTGMFELLVRKAR